MNSTNEKSGLYYANVLAHVTLRSIEEVVGTNGMNAILKHAGLGDLINNYPPKNWEKAFDFNDYSAVNHAIHDIYGMRGGRTLAIRAGRATFAEMRKTYGAVVSATDLARNLVPMKVKVNLWLNAMAKAFSTVCDQKTSVEEGETTFVYTVHQCPSCWGLDGTYDSPICSMQVGLLKESLNWLSNGKEFYIHEETCCATGEKACVFIIQKKPLEAA